MVEEEEYDEDVGAAARRCLAVTKLRVAPRLPLLKMLLAPRPEIIIVEANRMLLVDMGALPASTATASTDMC